MFPNRLIYTKEYSIFEFLFLFEPNRKVGFDRVAKIVENVHYIHKFVQIFCSMKMEVLLKSRFKA